MKENSFNSLVITVVQLNITVSKDSFTLQTHVIASCICQKCLQDKLGYLSH